jgi:hypothetical protein
MGNCLPVGDKNGPPVRVLPPCRFNIRCCLQKAGFAGLGRLGVRILAGFIRKVALFLVIEILDTGLSSTFKMMSGSDRRI